MGAPWFYFGCNRESGHYLFDERGSRAGGYGPSDQRSLRKALEHFDSVLPPISSDVYRARLYEASFSVLGGLGYCALSWWDGSVDSRPGSNSTVFAPGCGWTAESLLAAAREKLPWVFSRLPQPLILPAENNVHSPSAESASAGKDSA